MNSLKQFHQAQNRAVQAARAVGELMRQNLRATKRINSATQHDIKLELDVRCQKLIEQTLRSAYPGIAILGEEHGLGDIEADHRWVVDPIDGTVNFTYGIPHCCVSIALQTRKVERETLNSKSKRQRQGEPHPDASYETVVGVVYDPFYDELWTAIRGHPAYLNGKVIRVSGRHRLKEAVVSIGFAKSKRTLDQMIPVMNRLAHRVRKVRIMGAAALAMTYVASGRMDGYLETGIRLWDIAAGGPDPRSARGRFLDA